MRSQAPFSKSSPPSTACSASSECGGSFIDDSALSGAPLVLSEYTEAMHAFYPCDASGLGVRLWISGGQVV